MVLGDFFHVTAHTLLHLGLNPTSISTPASPLSLALGCSLAPHNDSAAILKGLYENGSKTGKSYSIFIPCFHLLPLLASVYVNKEAVHIQKQERRNSGNCVHSFLPCIPKAVKHFWLETNPVIPSPWSGNHHIHHRRNYVAHGNCLQTLNLW